MASKTKLFVLLSALALPLVAGAGIPKTKFRVLGNPPFEIRKNDASGLDVQIGAIRGPKNAMAALPFSYSITAPSGKEIVRDSALSSEFRIALAPQELVETGAYNVTISCLSGQLDGDDNFVDPELAECWSQDVFAYSAGARARIEGLRINAIAADYAPVLMFAPGEQYFPASVPYILNKIESNAGLASHKIGVRDATGGSGFKTVVKFNDLADLIKVQGNKNFLIDMGYEGSLSVGGPSEISVRFGEGKSRPEQKARVVIYYSVIPSRVSDDTLFLNYHTLYAYDSKGGDKAGNSGSTGLAGHAFDRESVTIKLKMNGGSVTPVSVIYGQHLADQTMAALDEGGNIKFTWLGGAVEIPWQQAERDGKHPKVAIARGSHAVYPTVGNYGVIFGGSPLLQEQAGGGEVVQPQNYQLRDLGILNFDPKSETSPLSFSGYWVTIFFGKPDAKFPPFTNRETDPDDYAAQAAKPGASGVPALSGW